MAYTLLLTRTMKRYVICALAAIALALNAQAEPKDKDNGAVYSDKDKVKPPKDKDKDNGAVYSDKDKVKPPKDKDKDNGGVYSVPDTGSTVLLLGSALLVLGVANRRFATR